MTSFHQFSALAASRNEGLHPKLRALLERAAASAFSEVSMRSDGMIQAGPSPDSEVTSSRGNVTPFSREPACVALIKSVHTQQQQTTMNKGADDMNVYDEWISCSHWGMFPLVIPGVDNQRSGELSRPAIRKNTKR